MAFGRLGALGGGFGRLGTGGGAGVSGAAGLLVGEADGFAADFLNPVEGMRVAVKVSNVVTQYAPDAFLVNGSTSAKQVFDATGALVWSPHNMFINSAVPATQSVTTIVGQNYTVTVTGSGSMTGSAGAAGVATAASPLTYTATTTTSTFTLGGSLTQIQMNRGAVATAYLATTAAARYGLAFDYDQTTLAAKGLLCEPSMANVLLNSTTLSTQSVTVSAVAYTLSFWGTGTITLTGVSTAGPLVGTGANNRVSLVFTPTAGSLTLTVTGTVTRAQLETSGAATSWIPTFGVTQTRAQDLYSCTSASINYNGTAGSWWVDCVQMAVAGSGARLLGYTSGATPMYHNGSTTFNLFDGTGVAKTVGSVFGAHKVASAFASGSRAITGDGGAIASDAGVVTNLLAPGASVFFGVNTGGANPSNGYIRRIFYVPRRMSNAELVAKTT